MEQAGRSSSLGIDTPHHTGYRLRMSYNIFYRRCVNAALKAAPWAGFDSILQALERVLDRHNHFNNSYSAALVEQVVEEVRAILAAGI